MRLFECVSVSPERRLHGEGGLPGRPIPVCWSDVKMCSHALALLGGGPPLDHLGVPPLLSGGGFSIGVFVAGVDLCPRPIGAMGVLVAGVDSCLRPMVVFCFVGRAVCERASFKFLEPILYRL